MVIMLANILHTKYSRIVTTTASMQPDGGLDFPTSNRTVPPIVYTNVNYEAHIAFVWLTYLLHMRLTLAGYRCKGTFLVYRGTSMMVKLD